MPDETAPVVVVQRIDHVGIAVPDLVAALAFFVDTFGFQLTHTERNDGQGVDEAMLSADNGAVVQLVAPFAPDHSPDTAVARFLARRGKGMHHLALEVRDVEAAAAALTGRGLRVIFDHPRVGTSGSRVNFVDPADAFGVLIELVERPAGPEHPR